MSKSLKQSAETRCLADVQLEPIDWLWRKRLARGKLNIIAGQPGLGKSQITAFMAATVSRGGAWPDGTKCPAGSVVLICCEDDAADTIAPRLDAARADRSKVHILDWINEQGDQGPRKRSFDIGKDAIIVREMCAQLGDVALIVVDPVSAYLGVADSHKTSDVRAALAPMQTIAADIGACVVLVSHLNKGSADTAAMSRVAGSGAFVAAARSAWIVGTHPHEEALRVFVPLKNNIGDDKTGFSYQIKSAIVAGDIETSHVEFDSATILLKAEDVLASVAPQGDASTISARGEAERFLRAELENGPQTAEFLRKRAKEAGIAWRTIERAKRNLGVRAEKDHGESGEWRWRIPVPDKDRHGRQDRHPPEGGRTGGLDHRGKDRQVVPSEKVGGIGGLGGVLQHLNGSAGELF